jgi:hypothetical protein
LNPAANMIDRIPVDDMIAMMISILSASEDDVVEVRSNKANKVDCLS